MMKKKINTRKRRRNIIIFRMVGWLLILLSIIIAIPNIVESFSLGSLTVAMILIVLNNIISILGIFIGLLLLVIAGVLSDSL